MKKAFRLLMFALAAVLLFAAYTSLTASAAANNVVYISADGTGDGSSPDSPIGNAPNYKPGNKMETYNAFYIGLDKLKNTGGTLVIVGEVTLDSVEARFTEKTKTNFAPSEFRCPTFKKDVSLKVTGVYNGVDYRTKGAKLVLDYETCCTTVFAFGCNTTLEKLNIEYKYHEEYKNAWNTPFMICGGGYNFIVGDEINVTSLNAKTNAPGDQYPMLMGGHRYRNIKNSVNLTVKSGTWSTVIAGSYGIKNTSYGNIDGSVTLSVSGGKIDTIIGTGSMTQPSGTVTGNVNIIISNGEIGEVFLTHPFEYIGSKIDVSIAQNAKVGALHYAPENYMGDLGALVSKVTVKNTSSLKIEVPKVPVAPATSKPAETQTPESAAPETTAPATMPPRETFPPETSAVSNSPNSDLSLKDRLPTVSPSVLLWIVIIVAVCGAVTAVIHVIKMNMLK